MTHDSPFFGPPSLAYKPLDSSVGTPFPTVTQVIAFQSSLMGSVGDNSSGGYNAYRLAKGALNTIAKGVSNEPRPRGVIAVALHPG